MDEDIVAHLEARAGTRSDADAHLMLIAALEIKSLRQLVGAARIPLKTFEDIKKEARHTKDEVSTKFNQGGSAVG